MKEIKEGQAVLVRGTVHQVILSGRLRGRSVAGVDVPCFDRPAGARVWIFTDELIPARTKKKGKVQRG